MGVDITIGVEHGEDVPLVRLGQLSDSHVFAGQELVDQISDGRMGDPLTGVDTALDEDSGFALAEAQMHALDLATFVGTTAHDHLHVIRVELGQRV